jgi:hypothetical protein
MNETKDLRTIAELHKIFQTVRKPVDIQFETHQTEAWWMEDLDKGLSDLGELILNMLEVPQDTTVEVGYDEFTSHLDQCGDKLTRKYYCRDYWYHTLQTATENPVQLAMRLWTESQELNEKLED